MAGKYGSASAFLLVDGYNLISNKLKAFRHKTIARQEDTTGLGDSWHESTPTGVKGAEAAQEGALFDTAEARIHEAMKTAPPSSPQASVRIVCAGFAGQTAGNPFIGAVGYSEAYEALAQLGALTKANVTHRITGALENGTIIQPLAQFEQDFVSASVDNSAATTGGGVGYLQIVSPGSFGAFTGVLRHSADDAVWETFLTFSTASGPTAERVTVTGTIKRYVRFEGVVWGDASASASISPSASLSPSTSLSPSVSASLSASASLSPSGSLSPSASSSPTRSASASVSPSSSLSPSLSASQSVSASISPSSSISPSVSASASVSPSTAAGAAGEVTVFCGLVRL